MTVAIEVFNTVAQMDVSDAISLLEDALAEIRQYEHTNGTVWIGIDISVENDADNQRILANLRQGLDEAIRGRTRPVNELFDGLEIEED